MVERAFKIFDGPDKGRTFIVSDKPFSLGREKGCDAVLDGDRTSRVHARLVPEGDQIFVVDENSSNGTFVNGTLVTRRPLEQGDIIEIGRNRIVFGAQSPSPADLAAIAGPVLQPKLDSKVASAPTQMLADGAFVPAVEPVETRITEIIEAVAEEAEPLAQEFGIHLSVEMEMKPDVAFVDPNRLHTALTGILAILLKLQAPTSPEEKPPEATVALRTGSIPAHDRFQIELIWIGPALPVERVAALEKEGAFRQAQYAAIQHGGILQIMPPDSHGTFARMILPLKSQDVPGRTLVRE